MKYIAVFVLYITFMLLLEKVFHIRVFHVFSELTMRNLALEIFYSAMAWLISWGIITACLTLINNINKTEQAS